MQRRAAATGLIIAMALIGACGTQVPIAKRRALESAQFAASSNGSTNASSLGNTGSVSGAGGGVDGGTGSGSGVGAGNGNNTATSTGSSNSGGGSSSVSGSNSSGSSHSTTTSTGNASTKRTGTAGSQTTTSSGVGAPAPAGGNGGATDVGVTADQILLGNVSDLSGPQPGLFQSAVNGTNAYIAYVNSEGGLYGRQLKIDVADSQTTCEGDRNGVQELIGKVFAFAGSFALSDECAATVFAANKDVPDAHLAVTPQANSLPNNFSVDPVGNRVNNGPYEWGAKKFGSAVQHAGFMYVNLPAVDNVASLSIKAAESAGWKFVQQQSVSATETDFTAEIIQMRQAGVQLFYSLFDAAELAEFVLDAQQQNYHPIIVAPLAYDQTFFTDLGGDTKYANGIYGFNGETLFFSAADIANIPSVATFHKWYSAVSNNAPADTFAADAWAETALLVQAMKAAGPDLTRTKVLQQLDKITSFDADGFFAPADPAAKKPGNCYVLWQIQGGQYVRIDDPRTGFRCDGVA